MGDDRQWYSNKELYVMMVELSKSIERVTAEMDQTAERIRAYNGLRERLNEYESKVDTLYGAHSGSKTMWGYVVGALGVLFGILAQIRG